MWVPIGSTSLFPLSPHLIYECISMATTFSMSCQKMQIIFDGNQFCQVYLSLLSFSVFQYFWHQVLLRNFASSLLSNLFLSYNHKQSTSCSWGLRLIKLLRGWYIAFFVSRCKVTTDLSRSLSSREFWGILQNKKDWQTSSTD